MHRYFTAVLILSILTTTPLFAQEELLIKIPENTNRAVRLMQERHEIKLRYRTQDFAIVQADRRVLPELPNAQILDQVTPGFSYYLLWLDRASDQMAIQRYGEILDQFGRFFLLKLQDSLESILFELPAHHRAKLPAEILLPEFEPPSAPSIPASPQQQVIIQDLLNQVNANRWFDQIRTLVDNEDLEQPGKFFRSRYSLRVRDAVQFDGKPVPDHACDNAAEYIAEQFRSYGLEVEFDPFDHRRRAGLGDLLGEYVMRNVVATLPGKGPNSDRIYLMVAHYDSIASKIPGWEQNWRTLPAPGASDNASGVVEILETARLLSQQTFDFTIRFIAFSGEELFLFGSKHYRDLVKERGDEIAGVLNFDLLGHDADGILDIHVLGDEQSQWLVNAFGTAAERYNISAELRLKNDPSFIFSDHSPFWEIGIPAVMVSEESSFEVQEESTEYVHSEEDTLAKITLPLGAPAVKLAVATLAELARPITPTSVEEQTNPDIFWEPGELSVSNRTPTKGDVVTIRATVQNAGPVAVAGITIQFVAVRSDGQSEVLAEHSVDLGIGESQTVNATFTPRTWGVFTLRALANNDANVFESDFGNNRIETELMVTDRELTIENIAAYPNPIHFNRPEAKLKLTYVLSRDADVVVAIYNAPGDQIFAQEFRAGENGGKLGLNDAFVWEGRNRMEESIAPGIYICQIDVTDENGESETEGTKVAVIR
ncbi:MAG: M28 family peptidase [Candidatus Poribacteria bacterium]|nr:M28 family peptidase [Candidatus Poribacteria bacterium]